MNTKNIIGIVFAIVLVVGGIVIMTNKSDPKVVIEVPKDIPTQTVKIDLNTDVATKAKGFTLTDIEKHANQTDCWSAVNGKVYNLTTWIEKHPGGKEAVLSICGKDGSASFNDQHGGERKPESILASFLIGDQIK
jgi:cytochrome b involved in lipid metabolism